MEGTAEDSPERFQFEVFSANEQSGLRDPLPSVPKSVAKPHQQVGTSPRSQNSIRYETPLSQRSVIIRVIRVPLRWNRAPGRSPRIREPDACRKSVTSQRNRTRMHTDLHGFFLKLGSLSSSAVDFVGSCLDTCWALIGFRNGFTPMRRSSRAPEDRQIDAAVIRHNYLSENRLRRTDVFALWEVELIRYAHQYGVGQKTQDSLVKRVSPWLDTSPTSDVPRW